MGIFEKLENIKPVNTWRPCIMFRNFFNVFLAGTLYYDGFKTSENENINFLLIIFKAIYLNMKRRKNIKKGFVL